MTAPANDPIAEAVETFSAPLEDLIVALGQGLAQAQQSLDQNSIRSQEAIDADPVLSQYGLQATWYQFPQVTLQLKMSLSVAQQQGPGQTAPPSSSSSTTNSTSSALPTRFPVRLIAQPLSASFQTNFNYDADAASEINVVIAPVPPPKPNNAVSSPPSMTPAQVQAAALASSAKFVTTTASGVTSPAGTDAQGDTLRFVVNYNAAAATWYVLQYAPANSAVVPIVVAVDDATGAVRIISSS